MNQCEEIVGIYIFSQTQWEIHNESNVKHEFLLRNLNKLKDSLQELNIPLVAFNSDSYRTLPQDLSYLLLRIK